MANEVTITITATKKGSKLSATVEGQTVTRSLSAKRTTRGGNLLAQLTKDKESGEWRFAGCMKDTPKNRGELAEISEQSPGVWSEHMTVPFAI